MKIIVFVNDKEFKSNTSIQNIEKKCYFMAKTIEAEINFKLRINKYASNRAKFSIVKKDNTKTWALNDYGNPVRFFGYRVDNA